MTISKGAICQEALGLVGWSQQEPTLLAALVANIPLLLVGSHGQGKTIFCERVAAALQLKFQPYDFSRLSKLELLGVLNPEGFKHQKLEYIETGTAVWNKEAVLFDEFTHGNPQMGSMIHELLTHHTVNGTRTKVQRFFAACNPAGEYSTNFLDLATASRFVIVEAPTYTDVAVYIDQILAMADNGHSHPKNSLRHLLDGANKVLLTQQLAARVNVFVAALAKKLVTFITPGVFTIGVRDILFIKRMVVALTKLASVGYVIEPTDMVNTVIACLPPLSRAVQTTLADTDLQRIRTVVSTEVVTYSIADLVQPINLMRLLKEGPKPTDVSGWASSVATTLEANFTEESGFSRAKEALILLKNLKGKLPQATFNAIAYELVAQWLACAPLEEIPDKPVTINNITRLLYHILGV